MADSSTHLDPVTAVSYSKETLVNALLWEAILNIVSLRIGDRDSTSRDPNE